MLLAVETLSVMVWAHLWESRLGNQSDWALETWSESQSETMSVMLFPVEVLSVMV
jgi:hypothetical protein